MIYAECKVCRRNRLVVTVHKDGKAVPRIRQHNWPGRSAIPDRKENGPCDGSRAYSDPVDHRKI